MKSNKIFKFIGINTRYLIVLGIFLFVIFYSISSLDDKEEDKKKDQKKEPQQKSEIFEGAGVDNMLDNNQGEGFVLDSENSEKILENFINSKKGDYYRLGFKVKIDDNFEGAPATPADSKGQAPANSEEFDPNNNSENSSGAGGVNKIKIWLSSDLENDQELAEIDLDENAEGWQEVVFRTEGSFRDVVFKLEGAPTNSEEFEGVKISDIKLSRLNVQSDYQLRNLRPTVFSEIKKTETDALDYYLKERYNDGLKFGGNKVSQQIEPSGRYGDRIGMKLKKIGNGGIGRYEIRVLFRDDTEKASVQFEPLERKVKFMAKDLNFLREDDGFVYFNFLNNFEREGMYFVEINNKDVEVDEQNYIQLENVKEDLEKVSYFRFYFFDFVSNVISGEQVFGGARIEDFGDHLIYSYQNNNSILDLVNIFESKGEVELDEEESVIEVKDEVDNFVTYKFDFEKVFDKANIKAEVYGGDSEKIAVEYSFDNLNWTSANSGEFEGAAPATPTSFREKSRGEGVTPITSNELRGQEIDELIENNGNKNSTIYFRVKCKSEEGGGHFGLSRFSVKAQLSRY